MRRLVRLAVRLYPASWRKRYGSEFEALVDDLEPGWRELFNIVNGALTMQIRALRVIPVAGAVVGALVGAVAATRMPVVYASSATIRVSGGDIADPKSAATDVGIAFQAALDKALSESAATKAATSVALLSGSAQQTIVKLTYEDSDPQRAQRIAETLTVAVDTANRELGRSAEILQSAALPTSPIRPDYATTIASSGGVGLIAGGAVLIILTFRRRSAGAS